MSIATKRGDRGKTNLIGGSRVSKGDLRVECYGTIDELNSQLGFARSICGDKEVHDVVEGIQRDLFKVSSAIAGSSESAEPEYEVTDKMVAALDAQVQYTEAIEGIVADWSLPGAVPSASAMDVARTVCRRAERSVVRLVELGGLTNQHILAYLNRLSDLLWLLGRLLELRCGVDAALRPKGKPGKRWSRAW